VDFLESLASLKKRGFLILSAAAAAELAVLQTGYRTEYDHTLTPLSFHFSRMRVQERLHAGCFFKQLVVLKLNPLIITSN